jgi:enoyl-[acyl-carrier protein] reductase III
MANHFKAREYYALLLGGSSGMGLATAKKLAAEGMNLFIVYRDPKIIEKPFLETIATLKLTSGVTISTFNSNALQQESIQSVITQIKTLLAGDHKIRLLLHSLSRGNLKLLTPGENQLSADDFQMTIHAMGINIFEWANALIRNNMFTADARIIALTSEGSSRSWPGYAAVGAAKAALENICSSMATEFAPLGIRTNVIQAGVTETPSFKMIPGHEKIKEETIKRNPFKRLTTPEDIANAIYLLCTDEAAWINGALLHVDGGEHCS